jgi:hypothetical protein
MADQRHSAYRRLGTARTNLIRSRANVRDIGLEQQFSAASSQMNLQDIANKSEAMSQFLNVVSAGAGLAMDEVKTQESIAELGELTGGTAEQTYGESSLWNLVRDYFKEDYRTRKFDWGEAGERLSVLTGMEDPRYQFKGGEYTSSQLESFLPYARMGKSFEEIKSMITSDPILREHKKDLDETDVMTLLDKYPEGYTGLADNPYSQGSGIGGGETGYIGVKGVDIQDDISRIGGAVESSQSGGEYRSNAIKAMMGIYTEDPLGIFSGNKKREPQGSYGPAGFGQNRLIRQHY